MVSLKDVRPGQVVKLDNTLYTVIERNHHKPGKGRAFVLLKIKNLLNGSVFEKNFSCETKIEVVHIESKPFTYSYFDGNFYVFMDSETYEQVELPEEMIGDNINFLLENMEINISFYDDKPISIEIPIFVNLKITECEPGVKGNTATNATKPAILETGHKVTVPLFINEGELIKVDTRTGKYIERAKV